VPLSQPALLNLKYRSAMLCRVVPCRGVLCAVLCVVLLLVVVVVVVVVVVLIVVFMLCVGFVQVPC
jgi:hypothetical protein